MAHIPRPQTGPWDFPCPYKVVALANRTDDLTAKASTMSRISVVPLTTLALALTLGPIVPAAASDSLARALGAEPGRLTPAERVALRRAVGDQATGQTLFILAQAEADAKADTAPGRYVVTMSAREGSGG